MPAPTGKTVVVPEWIWGTITVVSRSLLLVVAGGVWTLWNDVRDINTWRARELIIQQEAQAAQFQTQIDSLEERSRMNATVVQMLVNELTNVQIQLARLEERTR